MRIRSFTADKNHILARIAGKTADMGLKRLIFLLEFFYLNKSFLLPLPNLVSRVFTADSTVCVQEVQMRSVIFQLPRTATSLNHVAGTTPRTDRNHCVSN